MVGGVCVLNVRQDGGEMWLEEHVSLMQDRMVVRCGWRSMCPECKTGWW